MIESVNSQNNKNRVIVVLGMHRSGTSALTRSLQVLGINLGDNLHLAGADNPKGFWEDKECVSINEELLGRLGSEYDQLDLAWDFNFDDSSLNDLYSKAIQYVSQSIKKTKGVWGVKDPRICRLLGFWKRVFDVCDCSPSYIIALRDPLSVAESLQKRNGIHPEKSHFLWLQHMVPAVLDTRNNSRVIVNYDDLIDAPEKQLIRIAKCLKLPFDRENNPVLKDFLDNFLDNTLRHSRYSLSQVLSDNQIPHDVIKAYSLLMRVAQDEVSIDAPEMQTSFEEFRSTLSKYAAVFSYSNSLEVEIERLGLRDLMQEQHFETSSLPKNLTTGKVQLMITVAERNGEIIQLKQMLSDNNNEIIQLKQMLSHSNEKLTISDGINLQLLQEISIKDYQITNLSTTLKEIHQSRAWRLVQKYRQVYARVQQVFRWRK